MLIKEVLARKGKRVVSIWAANPLGDALRLIEENNISSAVVMNFDRKPIGLVTDRTILSAIARHGERAFELGAADVMITPAPTSTPNTIVREALRTMTDERVRHLVVMDDSRVAGIVSIGDLVKCRLDQYETETKVLREFALAQMAAN